MSENAMNHLHQKIEALQLENAELKENLQYMTEENTELTEMNARGAMKQKGLEENLQYMTDEGVKMEDACGDKDDQINCQAAEIYDLEDEAEKRKAELKECYQVLRGIKNWMRHVPKVVVVPMPPKTAEQLIAELVAKGESAE